MQLSQETITILKNFAGINQNLQFKTGNVIKTKAEASNVFAEVKVEEDFPQDFAIYELGRFLSAISLFEIPQLNFKDTHVEITDGTNSLDYTFADPSLISAANYDKPFKMPPVIAKLELTQANLAQMQKAASVLGAPTVTLCAVNGELLVKVHDVKNPSSDKFKLNIGETDAPNFNVDLKLETLRFIPGDYTVEIGEKVVVKFTHTAKDIVYMVAGDITTNI